jgi:hypothetical protein
MQSHDAELQHCYEEAVVSALMRAGGTAQPVEPLRLDIEIEVAASGDVQSAELRGDASPEMSRCMRDSIRAWRFPPASAPTQVRFPVIFQPTIVQR